jgi:hypothetical protein
MGRNFEKDAIVMDTDFPKRAFVPLQDIGIFDNNIHWNMRGKNGCISLHPNGGSHISHADQPACMLP